MNSIFKKQLLLGLMLAFMPVIVAEEAIRQESEQGFAELQPKAVAPEVMSKPASKSIFNVVGEYFRRGKTKGTSSESEAYERFIVTGKCHYCDLQGMDLRDVLKKLRDEGKKVSFLGANLTGANLSGADLKEVSFHDINFHDLGHALDKLSNDDEVKAFWMGLRTNLTGADLSGADLSGANFFKTILTDALLGDTDLTGVNFDSADLTNIDLSGATLFGVHFQHANLTGANLSGVTFVGTTYLFGANLTEADLSETTFIGSPDIENPLRDDKNSIELNSGTILTGANLSHATFYGVDLAKVDFTGATGINVKFVRSKVIKEDLPAEILETAIFEDGVPITKDDEYDKFVATGDGFEYKLQGKDLREGLKKLDEEGKRVTFMWADLTGADLSGTTLFRASFDFAKLIKANLSHAQLVEAHLFGVNLTEADLTGANLTGARFAAGGDFSRTNFAGANLSDATFSKVDLTDADFTGATGTNVKFIESKVNKENLPAEILETAIFEDTAPSWQKFRSKKNNAHWFKGLLKKSAANVSEQARENAELPQ